MAASALDGKEPRDCGQFSQPRQVLKEVLPRWSRERRPLFKPIAEIYCAAASLRG